MNPFTTRQTSDGDLVVQFSKVDSGWEQWLLLSSDRHWDNPKSDLDMQRRHLQQVVKRNALVVDIGDFHCVMQGKADKRGAKGDVRPEHQVSDYFSAIHRTSVDFVAPYAHHWLLMGTGNHELSVLKHNEIDLTGDLVQAVNDRTGSNIYRGHLAGWVKLQFRQGTARKSRPAINLYYHHGYGGGGPVTRGVIQTNRRAVYLPDATVVVTGHIHEEWLVPISRERINDQGITYRDKQYHVQLPTYKDEWKGRKTGWHHERGGAPKPLGAVWMRLWLENDRVKMEFTPAD